MEALWLKRAATEGVDLPIFSRFHEFSPLFCPNLGGQLPLLILRIVYANGPAPSVDVSKIIYVTYLSE